MSNVNGEGAGFGDVVLDAVKHPIDFASLQRGDIVSAETIEAASGLSRNSKEYDIYALGLSTMIQKHFLQDRNDDVACPTRKGAIHILRHEEQDKYVAVEKKKTLRRFLRLHRKDLAVDVAQLPADAVRIRERRLNLDGWRVQQLARRKPPLLEG